MLPGAGAVGKVQWQSATARAHHQTRKFAAALSVDGSGPGQRSESTRVAQPVLPKGNATGTEDREKWQGRAAWRFLCTGCGVTNEITSGEESVGTQESPEQAIVCRTPSN